MSVRTIMLLPVGNQIGFQVVVLGLIQSLAQNNRRVTILQLLTNFMINDGYVDNVLELIKLNKLNNVRYVQYNIDIDLIVENYNSVMDYVFEIYKSKLDVSDIILVTGLKNDFDNDLCKKINYDIANNIKAEILLVISLNNYKYCSLRKKINVIKRIYGINKILNFSGVILNKFNKNILDKQDCLNLDLLNQYYQCKYHQNDISWFMNGSGLHVVAIVPLIIDLLYIPVSYIINHCNIFNMQLMHTCKREVSNIRSVIFFDQISCIEILKKLYTGVFLIIPFNRIQLLFSTFKIEELMNKISMLIVTNTDLCSLTQHNFLKKLILIDCNSIVTDKSIFFVLTCLRRIHIKNIKINLDILKYLNSMVVPCFDTTWIHSLQWMTYKKNNVLPIDFKYQLRYSAQQSICRKIVLPEGEDIRIIKAAVFCGVHNIADCILLGNSNRIFKIALQHDIKLGDNIHIIQPDDIRKNYINRLVELRKHKGMNYVSAIKEIKNNIVLGTLMLEKGDVHGLVAGVITTTAECIRPSLQLIKTDRDYSLVSSAFFMLFPNRVCVYADCAINIDPNCDQLSQIAIQSAESAILFGIEPKIAMISYSTGSSGAGPMVDKVRQASIIVKKKRPELIIDGPLQYDAAMMVDVSRLKAPTSEIDGQATVFIFPDLNSGNAIYKAVQRESNISCVGPILQGMYKPINDLSRGASVEDIIYTIAATVIQAN
ncbi:MAG: phosphate acetyltransferase [Buchnera aphidicola (Eriosoma harunire)]